MIKPPKDTDINKVNEMLELSLDCYFLSAIVACWTLKQNLNNGYPVYIVTLTNKEMLSHTVCVIRGVGTLDAKPVFDWFDTQRKSHDHCKQWIIYNTNDIIDKKLLLFGDYTSFTNSWKIF